MISAFSLVAAITTRLLVRGHPRKRRAPCSILLHNDESRTGACAVGEQQWGDIEQLASPKAISSFLTLPCPKLA